MVMPNEGYYEAVSETIGQRIRRLREERKLSVVALAQMGGIGENALRKIESGESKQPSFTTGVRLAVALGVDPWALAFGRPKPSGVSETAAALSGEERTELQSLRTELQELRDREAIRDQQLTGLLAVQEQREQQVARLQATADRLAELVAHLRPPR